MRQIAKVLVGSRLHGLHTDTSDYDYRGIHMHDLREKLIPFNELTYKVQELDRPYMDAIRKVAREYL